MKTILASLITAALFCAPNALGCDKCEKHNPKDKEKEDKDKKELVLLPCDKCEKHKPKDKEKEDKEKEEKKEVLFA